MPPTKCQTYTRAVCASKLKFISQFLWLSITTSHINTEKVMSLTLVMGSLIAPIQGLSPGCVPQRPFPPTHSIWFIKNNATCCATDGKGSFTLSVQLISENRYADWSNYFITSRGGARFSITLSAAEMEGERRFKCFPVFYLFSIANPAKI